MTDDEDNAAQEIAAEETAKTSATEPMDPVRK